MSMANDFDAIVIGTGAGGGTLALHLAQAGKNILILERGPFMPQEKLNWDTSAVFLDNRYHTKETWQDKDGKPLHPQQAYFVGGQTKVYGAAMFRMRAEDFGVIQHKGGISPAWPITYADMEPFYCRAEDLFHVHGDLGSAPSVPGGYGSSFDPTEPFHSIKYPYPAFTNEPRMQTIEDDVRKLGIHTFPIPLGLKRNAADPLASKCVRCDTCDGYPCLVHAKSDADINCIRQIMHWPNVTLMTNSRVTRLLTNSSGTAVTAVEVIHSGTDSASKDGNPATYRAGFFAVCAGAINSAVILLASANDKHPNGLANRSDQVGRNFMYHQADALLALGPERNEDSYTKTWGTNDFYFKDSDPGYPFPLGQVQPVGSFHSEMMKGDAPPLTPGFVLETMKHHAVPWWLTTEDLPDPDNRVTLHNTTPLSVENRQPGVAGPHPPGTPAIPTSLSRSRTPHPDAFSSRTHRIMWNRSIASKIAGWTYSSGPGMRRLPCRCMRISRSGSRWRGSATRTALAAWARIRRPACSTPFARLMIWTIFMLSMLPVLFRQVRSIRR